VLTPCFISLAYSGWKTPVLAIAAKLHKNGADREKNTARGLAVAIKVTAA
jgi:hypothetical protein